MEFQDEDPEENQMDASDDDSSDSDSEKSMDDAELLLKKQFLQLLSSIANERYNYENYVLLVNAAKKLTDLDKIRQSYELFASVFPLSPSLWLDWLKTESAIANEPEELKNLCALFNRALKDYYSIEIALEFAGLTKRLEKEEASKVWKELISAYIYDFNGGAKIFKLWREYYNNLAEPDSPEKFKTIIKNFKKELLLPLKGASIAYEEFKSFLKTNETKLQEFNITVDPDKIESTFKETTKIFNKIMVFEIQLSNLEENNHKDRIQLYLSYINECSDLEEENVQILYERMATACCLNVSVWKEYIKYLESRSDDWQDESPNDSWIFNQNLLDLVERGLRNCTWSEDLFIEKMRIFEGHGKTLIEIQKVFEEGCAVQYRSPDPQVKLWLAYLSYMARQTDYSKEDEKEKLRKCFDYSWQSLGKLWGDLADPNCEILKFWGHLEYEEKKLNNPGKAKGLWKSVLESSDNYTKSGLWIEYAILESHKHLEICRHIFRRAVGIKELDNLEVVVSAWTRFERLNGTIEQLKECQEKCEKVTYAYQQFRKREFSSRQPGTNKRKHQDSEDSYLSHKKRSAGEHKDSKKTQRPQKPEPTEEEPVEIDKTKDNIRVFLSNLDFNVTEEEIKESLSALKIINVNVIKNNTGKSRGFGYAELPSETEVNKALTLDRTMINGRPVFISKCQREKDAREKVKYENKLELNKVFVKGLRNEVTKEELQELFEPIGEIRDCRIVYRKDGKSKGIAYVEYAKVSAAQTAVQKLDQTDFHGKTLTVAISNPPEHSSMKMDPKTKESFARPAPVGAKPRLSFIPTSVQKKVAKDAEAPTTTAKSNDDFRKMFLK